jgi:methyl-accepting chemotaxis protein
MIKIKDMSFKSKLLVVVVPLIGISLILLFLTSTFINGFTSKITNLGNSELVNLKRQTLLLEAKNVMIESNGLLYNGKDALLKLSQKEDNAAENYLTQLEIINGKISTVAGQLLSLGKENENKKLISDFQSLSVSLKKWGEDVNQKKLSVSEASDEFKKNRKLIKTFLKESVTFDDNIVSTTPALLEFVHHEESSFKYKALSFVIIIFLIGVFSFFIIKGLIKFEHDSAIAMKEAVRTFNMVETAPINIMMADTNGILTYMNESTKLTLRKLEQFLPEKVDNLLGKTIDHFHKDPAVQRKMLSDPKNLPHKSIITIGPEKVSILVSAIYDNQGSFTGPMVSWEVVTEKFNIVAGLTRASLDLATAAQNVLTVSTSLSAAAEETSAQANTASVASEEVNAGVQTVANNMEEMVSAIKDITKTTNEASIMTTEAMSRAKNTNAIINKLGDSSIDIGNVIKVISSIAQQTNLLALNATIEAARAGDAGKGFAVVANEVKELANQTAKATSEITKKIETIQADSKSAIDAIGEISIAIEKVHGYNSNIAAAVEEQAATTNDVKRIVSESAIGVTQINENISQVSLAAANTGKDAHKSEDAAKKVDLTVIELNKFVASLKM